MLQKIKIPVLKKSMLSLGLIVIAGVMVASPPMSVVADTFDDQIAQLQNEVNSYQGQVAELQGRASTLQNVIAGLQAQQNAIQSQIALKQAELEKLQADIVTNEAKLARQKRTVSKTVAQIYVNGSTTAIELLAGSRSVGEYISSQEVRSTVRNKMKAAMDEVKRIRIELETQKVSVEENIKDQEDQRNALAAKQAEQDELLALTQGEEAAFQSLIAGANAEIANKRAAQAAAMAAANRGNGRSYGSSSYPWMSSTMGYDDYCNYYDGSVSPRDGSSNSNDGYGYCMRQCVSYVAWKLSNDGRGNYGYSGLGNANGWGYGGSFVEVKDIQPGDVIVWYVGGYGHVMYVEWADGASVGISQMNVPYDSGEYSTDTYLKSTLQNGPYEARRFH